MTLEQYIQANPTKTNAEVLAHFNTASVEKKSTTRWTWVGLADHFGPSAVSTIDGVLKAAGMDWVRQSLASTGLDLGHATVQSMLEQFRPSFGDLLTNNLKTLGVWLETPWVAQGGTHPMSENEIVLTRNKLARDALLAEIETRTNAARSAVEGGAVHSLPEVLAILGGP